MTFAVHQTQVLHRDAWLIVRFPTPHNILSWAVTGGGKQISQTIAWHQVKNADLHPDIEPKKFLQKKLTEIDCPDAVGLLTSAPIERYGNVLKESGELWVRCIATVGLTNALRIGDPANENRRDPEAITPRVGTINLLCQISHALTDEAMLEAMSLACEARTLACLESNVQSIQSHLPATGTGTDCIVMAAPLEGSPFLYAGKHTLLGSLIGSAVLEAIQLGIERWKIHRNYNQKIPSSLK